MKSPSWTRGLRQLLRRKVVSGRTQVHFLLRSDYEAVRQNGVGLTSEGNFQVHPHAAGLREIGRIRPGNYWP